MNRINRERIKSIIISVLLITSLIQVGILWGYTQRLPINFFAAILGYDSAAVNDDMARSELFVPYRMSISNGETNHWIIGSDEDLFKDLWDEAKSYLNGIAIGQYVQQVQDLDWGDLITGKGFVFDFKTVMSPDLLKWFLEISGSTGDMPSVYKMMIKPDSLDDSAGEFYILTGEGKVLKYKISNYDGKSAQKTISTYENDEKGIYRVYTSMRDSGFDDMDIAPDILYVARSPKYWPYKEILCNVPSKIGKMDELANVLLGSEKDRFIQNAYDDNTIQFYNNINVYKIYGDGFLEYSYSSGSSSSGKGNIGDAMVNAYRFINQLKKLTDSDTGIYLSGVDDTKQGYYSFSFDYKIDGLPVFVNYLSGNSKGETVKHAFTIDAGSKRVFKCSWVIRDLAVGVEKKYNDRFIDIMNAIGESNKKMGIRDISTGYMISSRSGKLLKPLMILEKKDSGIQTVQMPVEEGS